MKLAYAALLVAELSAECVASPGTLSYGFEFREERGAEVTLS